MSDEWRDADAAGQENQRPVAVQRRRENTVRRFEQDFIADRAAHAYDRIDEWRPAASASSPERRFFTAIDNVDADWPAPVSEYARPTPTLGKLTITCWPGKKSGSAPPSRGTNSSAITSSASCRSAATVKER